MNSNTNIIVPEFFRNYIKSVPDGNLIDIHKEQAKNLIDFYSQISEEKSLYRYAEGKWSLRELIGHITDAERIFAYSILRIVRNDKTPLPGYDENPYVTNASFDQVKFSLLLNHYENVRQSNIDLFSTFTIEDLDKTGTIENNELSVKALIAIIIGHAEHHLAVVQERYL
jgi:uncharacterized damage-inducible protein DinB